MPASAEEWSYRNVSLLPAHLTESLLIKIEFTSDGGNYIYIDDFIVGEDPTLALHEINPDDDLLVYPVPFNDVLHVEWRNENQTFSAAKLFDIKGREIWSGSSAAPRLVIPVGHIPHGSYVLQVQTNDGIITRKVVK